MAAVIVAGQAVRAAPLVPSSLALDSKRPCGGCKPGVAGRAGGRWGSSLPTFETIINLEWRLLPGVPEWRIGLALEFSFWGFDWFQSGASFVRGPVITP